MLLKKLIVGVFALSSLTVNAGVGMTVFVDYAMTKSQHFVNDIAQLESDGIAVNVIDVELAKRQEDLLSEGLPKDEEEATKVAIARLKDPQNKPKLDLLKQGLANYVKVVEYNIEAIPAVLFDHKYIVYGENPSDALLIYKELREGL